MKKLAIAVLSLSVFTSSLALAGPLEKRAQAIADKISSVEADLYGRDAEELRYELDRIDYILSRYDRGDNGNSKYICVSNGQTGVWEKFYLKDINSNDNLGGATDYSTCQELLKMTRNNLICLSNGQTGVWEKFQIYDMNLKTKLGGQTDFSTCKDLISASNRNFICISNGQTGVWEKFTLFNRRTSSKIGGSTEYSTCVSSIPK